MKALWYTLLSDGSSDKMLMPVLDWLLDQHLRGIPFRGAFADFGLLHKPPPLDRLDLRIKTALYLFPCDILFVHRDAETRSYQERISEIKDALQQIGQESTKFWAVKVIPIRMSEAWLLINEGAIRAASGNRKGKHGLHLPPLNKLESLPNPKNKLIELIRAASDLKGRKLQRLNEHSAIHRVATYISDFQDLRKLSAFRNLEQELIETLNTMSP